MTVEEAVRDRIHRLIGKALIELAWQRPKDAAAALDEATYHLRALAAGEPPPWPADCHDPDSCARHRKCMYHPCRHLGKGGALGAEIEVAIAAAPDDPACMTEFEARLGLGLLDREPSERRRAIVAAAQLLRAAGWTCKPPPDPDAPCSHCGKPADFSGPCPFGGCPLGADL